jgi:hypothetical protein
MSSFARSFPVGSITEEVIESNPWFADLLRYWRPAGDALHRGLAAEHALVSSGEMAEEDPKRLRLAIRDGYVNFYRGGQSVARVGFGNRGGLQARIHNKYIYGQEGSGQNYLTITSAGVADRKMAGQKTYGGLAYLRGWIANANDHTGEEKKFVDMVVARNPNTIDLEMALPAYSLDPKERRAPRMDLVAIEPVGERWQIVFWEAKLVDDGRARCRGEAAPKVVEQLAQYTRWLRHANHRDLVVSAFQETCRLLVALRGLAAKVNPDIEELGAGIIAAAASDASPLLLDDVPRLLIDDRAANAPFTNNGHLKKLRDEPCGLHVQMVSGLDNMTLKFRS